MKVEIFSPGLRGGHWGAVWMNSRRVSLGCWRRCSGWRRRVGAEDPVRCISVSENFRGRSGGSFPLRKGCEEQGAEWPWLPGRHKALAKCCLAWRRWDGGKQKMAFFSFHEM